MSMPKRYLTLLICLLFLIFPGQQASSQVFKEGEVIYQVFVRAFADSDDDGVGDFNGLRQKLPYLKNLGVGALWLMPIHPSPTYHGYDVTDYRDVNPDYGSLQDFCELLSAAHAQDIKVLIDLPLNHTSSRHPWFIESQQPGSARRDWYHWVDGTEPGVDIQQVVWGEKPWRRWVNNVYYYAIFWDGMPDLNYANPEVFEEAVDIACFWLQLGVDGFRLDATSHIFGQGEGQSHQDTKRSADFWQRFKAAVKAKYPKAFLLGEAWEALDRRALLLSGLDSVVNFDLGDRLLPLLKSGGSGSALVSQLASIYAAYQATNPDYVDAPFLSNHDQTRTASVLMMHTDKLKLAARILLSLPGLPIVYYGEEIGMAGAKPDEELRTPMLWGGKDPLQTAWRASKYNKRTVPVAQQEGDEEALLETYRTFIHLRKELPALAAGSYRPYEVNNSIPMAFWRETADQRALVLHNPSATAQQMDLPAGYKIAYAVSTAALGPESVVLPGLGTVILLYEAEQKDSP